MSAITPNRKAAFERKRRTHAKSRKGCDNCKLRRVKCDETKPQCNKCRSYGVSCDFAGCNVSLDVAAQGSFQVHLAKPVVQGVLGGEVSQNFHPHDNIELTSGPMAVASIANASTPMQRYDVTSRFENPWSPVSLNGTMVAMISDSLRSAHSNQHVHMGTEAELFSSSAFWEFSESNMEILTRFQSRTALTIGDYRMASGYRDIVCQLALQHPFLMHMVLGITLMHDSDLSLAQSCVISKRQKHLSLLHWDLATNLFQRVLSQPLPPDYRDAMWATGVHLGAASFWNVESSDEGAVWPLKPTEPSDFSWMKIGKGKSFLWRIADPMRKDGMFHEVLKLRPRHLPPHWENGQDTDFIPDKIKRVFGINDESTKENNAYLFAVVILSRVRYLTLTHANALDFLQFSSFITPEFVTLLEGKDPLAVFLMGWWFSLIEHGDVWWMVRRAKIQGEAVKIWLRRENEELADLLDEIYRESEKVGVQRILCSLVSAEQPNH